MKYSFMSFSTPELDSMQIAEFARKHGYEAFEARISSSHRHGLELDTPKQVVKEIRNSMEKSGVEICCIATGCSYSNPESYEENIETTKASIDLAYEAGAPLIRVFGGVIPEGISREKSFDLIVGALKKLSDYAFKKNIIICVETHDHWCVPEAVEGIMKAVDHPSVAVNWDIMHPVLREGYSIESAFNILKPWIKHVHIHDGNMIDNKLVFLPIGEGAVDHKTAVKLLKNSGYEGYLSGEWIGWEPYELHLPRELHTMRSYEQP